MANGKSINIDITKFDGDPDILPFFLEQIKSVALINKLTDQATVTLLKSKLQGPALKFLTQKSELLTSNDFDTIVKALNDFFTTNSVTNDTLLFNNIMLQPGESIKNLAHRLDTLASKIYSDIKDQNALNKIKLLKFISTIPSNIRVKLQEENITDYTKAVNRAQQMQEIFNAENILNSQAPANNEINFAESLKILNEKINNLQVNLNSSQNHNQSPEASQNKFNFGKKNTRGFRYHKNQGRGNFRRNSPHNTYKNKIVTCQLCRRNGHEAQQCFKWTRPNSRYQNNGNRRQWHNNDNHNQTNYMQEN